MKYREGFSRRVHCDIPVNFELSQEEKPISHKTFLYGYTVKFPVHPGVFAGKKVCILVFAWNVTYITCSTSSTYLPLIFAGLRLQSRTTIRLLSSSNVMYCLKPLTTVRGFSSPTSIFSTYKDSASGCYRKKMGR